MPLHPQNIICGEDEEKIKALPYGEKHDTPKGIVLYVCLPSRPVVNLVDR